MEPLRISYEVQFYTALIILKKFRYLNSGMRHLYDMCREMTLTSL